MTVTGRRKLHDGREVPVHANHGLRKICDCPRRRWPTCKHGWHLSLRWQKRDYRFSLDRHVGRRVESKAEVVQLVDTIRTAIRAGTFRGDKQTPAPNGVPQSGLSFAQFAEIWKSRRGCQLSNARDNAYRLGTICRYPLPGLTPPGTFGGRDLRLITVSDIEAFRESRKASGLSAVAVNHDLRLLRKMFNWAVRNAYLERTPFKIGSETVIKLEQEVPRNKRLEGEEDEAKLLAAANEHLRAVIIAILDTACRPGEILSLQWRDVSLKRKEIRVLAEKEKTRRERIIPISSRLMAVLEMRKLDRAGQPVGPDSYVFGNEVGERVRSVRTAWANACKAAGIEGFQPRDLRHEAASRFDEAGMPIIYVSNMLGHSNLTTTSRYLNLRRRGLHLAMQKYEESRRLASSLQDQPDGQAEPPGEPGQPASQNQLVS